MTGYATARPEPNTPITIARNTVTNRPNIVYFHVDNLGLGELGCFGGGMLRGADTKRIDQFAEEGLRLSHFVVEPQCTPTRSALMTGRYPIRSGNHTIALGGNDGGLVAWERTMGDILSEAGYATACFGKWHIGAEDGRWPTDHGFDEWYGPLRTYDECLWPDDPWYDGERDGYSYMHEGTREHGVRATDQQLTQALKGEMDAEYDRRAKAFMKRSAQADKPFSLYHNTSLMHFPMVVRDEFKGQSTNGEWGDCLMMLDHDFGSAEGGIRTPCLIRWPGKVPVRESNEMVHVTDMFPTLLRWAGCEPPADRIIDGVDQHQFFSGGETSPREGCMVWLNEELHAVKWSQFKVSFKRQQHFHDPEMPLGFARIINLLEDPKEREPVNQKHVRWWVMQHARRIIRQFEDTVEEEQLIPCGAPIDFVPAQPGARYVVVPSLR